MATRTFSGSTSCDDWVQHPTVANQIYVDIDLSPCRFRDTPVVVTSLVGENKHWSTTGGSEPYHPSATGFRINVRFSLASIVDGQLVYKQATIEDAKTDKWRINWIAVGECMDG